MIDTLEVLDTFTADTIEPGDLISFTTPDGDEILSVTSVNDDEDTLLVVGVSEVTGDQESYLMLPDKVVSLMGEPVEDI
jgi:hypothetical protein